MFYSSSLPSSPRSPTPPRLQEEQFTPPPCKTTSRPVTVTNNHTTGFIDLTPDEEYSSQKRYEVSMYHADGQVRIVSCPQSTLSVNPCEGFLRFFADRPGGTITSCICTHVCSTRTYIATGDKKCGHCLHNVEKVCQLFVITYFAFSTYFNLIF